MVVITKNWIEGQNHDSVEEAQYKGYNLIGVTTLEGSTTRGTTALVMTGYIAAYIQGLYKGDTVHPTGLTVNQRQYSPTVREQSS